MGVGIVLIIISGTHRYLRNRALLMDQNMVSQFEQRIPIKGLPKPVHIYAQWFLDTDIEEEVFADNKWTVSEVEASHLAQSAVPGEKGNIIIYGHNKREILGNIRAFKGSETITIKTSDGLEHQYKISKLLETDPNDVKYLEPTDSEVLTIYTCSGLMDSKRFIVRAEPVNKG